MAQDAFQPPPPSPTGAAVAPGSPVAAGQPEPPPGDLLPRGPDNRRLALNFLYLTAGEGVAKLLTFAAFAYLGRVLGPERYGSLEFVLAVMVFFTLPTEMGLGSYGAREIARHPGRTRALLGEITELRLLLSAVSFAALLAFLAILRQGGEVTALLALYGVSLLLTPALLQWFFQGHNQMHWVALASIVRNGVLAGLLFLFVRPGTSLAVVGLAECVSVLGVAALCLVVVKLRFGLMAVWPRLRPAGLLAHLREALPIGLSQLAWAFLWYFATVLLGFLVAGRELGFFGASHRAAIALHTFVWLYFFNLLPSIARCAALPNETLRRLMDGSIRAVAWGSLFVALLTTLLARELLVTVYGPAFAGATRSFAILMWMVPVAMLSGHYRFTLIGYGLQKLEFYCNLAAGGVAVALCLALIPPLGAVGAAAALLAANVVNFALARLCVDRRVAVIPFGGRLPGPLTATVAGAVAYLALARRGAWLAGAAAAAAYALVFMIWERRGLARLARDLSRRAPWRPADAARAR